MFFTSIFNNLEIEKNEYIKYKNLIIINILYHPYRLNSYNTKLDSENNLQ